MYYIMSGFETYVFICAWHEHLAHSLPISCVLLPKAHAFDSIACFAPFQIQRQLNQLSIEVQGVCNSTHRWNTMCCILGYISKRY